MEATRMLNARVSLALFERVDAEAKAAGVSRTVFVRRALESAILGAVAPAGVAAVTPLVERAPAAALMAKAAREAAAVVDESKLRRCPVKGCRFRASSPSPRLMCPTHCRPMLPLEA